MERRRAVIVAATASLTLLAGAGAVGLNTSLVSGSGNDGVGEISPVDTTIPSTVVADGPDPCATSTPPGSKTEAPGAPSTGTEDGCEDEHVNGDEQEYEGEPGDAAEQEYEYEYEGAEDDD